MTTTVLLILLLSSFVALLFKKQRVGLALIFVAMLWTLIVGQGFFAQVLLNRLQVRVPLREPKWKLRNVIVVLGAGTVRWPQAETVSTYALGYSRVHEAARLYFNCKEKNAYCRLLTTGGDPRKNGISEAEVMRGELSELGIPPSDIIIEAKSNNTFQNAQFSSPIIKEESFDQAVLVTSGIHLSRALMYFSFFRVDALGAPSDHLVPASSFLPLSINFMLTDFALHECEGRIRFEIYNFLGLNQGSPAPGSP